LKQVFYSALSAGEIKLAKNWQGSHIYKHTNTRTHTHTLSLQKISSERNIFLGNKEARLARFQTLPAFKHSHYWFFFSWTI